MASVLIYENSAEDASCEFIKISKGAGTDWLNGKQKRALNVLFARNELEREIACHKVNCAEYRKTEKPSYRSGQSQIYFQMQNVEVGIKQCSNTIKMTLGARGKRD